MAVDPAALQKPVADILNFEGLSAQDLAASQGSQFTATGATDEQQAYLTAKEIAEQNERLAEISGQIQNAQTERQVGQTLGAQRATVASSGFANSGTALALAKSSRQQGYLKEQLTTVDAQLQEGGYAGQAAAAGLEAAAAGTASSAATALAAEQASQGALMKSYAAAEADALNALTGGGGSGFSNGPVFNGVSWTYPTTPQSGVANDIANTTKTGQPLTADELAAAAVQEGGGGAATGIGGNPAPTGGSGPFGNQLHARTVI